MTLSWDKNEIRNLRRRLGWTQADLARRLSCESIEIQYWEEGTQTPSTAVLQQFEILERQAEQCSEEVHAVPVAEEICQQQALSQIDFNKISDDIKE